MPHPIEQTEHECVDYYSDMTEDQRTELLMSRNPAGTLAGFGIDEFEAKLYGDQMKAMNS